MNYMSLGTRDRPFQVFVANRISTINQLSQVDEWHHVSGKNNLADIISSCEWIHSHMRQYFWIIRARSMIF